MKLIKVTFPKKLEKLYLQRWFFDNCPPITFSTPEPRLIRSIYNMRNLPKWLIKSEIISRERKMRLLSYTGFRRLFE